MEDHIFYIIRKYSFNKQKYYKNEDKEIFSIAIK